MKGCAFASLCRECEAMNINMRDLPVVFFEEDGVVIAHCVPLDVSSCGHDLREARRNILDAVAGFVLACEQMDTLEEILGSC